ncbi:tetratricopeptide repeat protein [Paenibacillus gansuensis]|uniref:Tetratricopeptide repeat protein n=1 Tax=Paenibacillus gansuensis TaxID=306542 RepID=A0ABW5P9U8_9BACL
MIKPIFASMNEVLDGILAAYPTASGSAKLELDDKLTVLKAMSETLIEEWLLFEEKLRKLPADPSADTDSTLSKLADDELFGEPFLGSSEDFRKGQGYFKLLMFHESVRYFSEVIRKQPDFVLARLYLALSYLKTGDLNEAYPHFQMIIQFTENKKMKAISYNALGCIQAQRNHTEKACEYFKAAYKMDPSIAEPLANLEVCSQNQGTLKFGAGLTH